MNSKGGVAAVDRAFDILLAFQREKPVLSLAEIARITGLYKSTILRLMGSLEKYSFILQRADGQYQLGAGLLSMASIFQDSFSLRELVEPVLEELVTATNEGATFYVLDGNEHLCLFRVDGRHAIRDYNIRVGDRRPLNDGAAATIFRRFREGADAPLTRDEYTAGSFGAVTPEMAALAAPVFGANNALVGVITLSGPITRFNQEHAEELTPALIEATIRLSISLGASPSRFSGLREG
jgi:DNA-binding IclR family transcriptional regulator